MRINFEPTRLSDDFLTSAYEIIFPSNELTNKKSSMTSCDEQNTVLTSDEVI